MHDTPIPPDSAPHPEAAENRLRGSNRFHGVHGDYFIDSDIRPIDGRRQRVDVLLSRGLCRRWYAPFVHSEIPGELAKLRAAEASAIVEFAATYGLLGYADLVTEDPITNAFHIDARTGQRSGGGDPLPWIRAHANGVHICLALTEALRMSTSPVALRQLLEGFKNEPYGENDHVHRLWFDQSGRYGDTFAAIARQVRNRIINAHLRGITRAVTYDATEKRDRSFFRFDAVVQVAYWHLANVLDGGTVKRCEADGCSGLFIQSDPRQRYCPKRFRQRESACAARQRQRDIRAEARS